MRHIVLWLGCLGATLATARLRHINIDVFSRVLPPRWRGPREVVVHVATVIATYALGVAALRLVVDEKAFGDAAFMGVQTWVLQTILPFSFFLISYRSLVNMLLRRRPRVEGEG
jgi:TRAP-type C4-dicarboxylate transport system permease small subunit